MQTICEEQFGIWLGMYQGFSAFVAIVNAVVLFVMRNSLSSDDYRKKDLLIYLHSRIKLTLYMTLSIYGVMTILFIYHSCTPLRVWAVLLFGVFILLSLCMLVYSLIRLNLAVEYPLPLEEIAKQRFRGILRSDCKKYRRRMEVWRLFDKYVK